MNRKNPAKSSKTDEIERLGREIDADLAAIGQDEDEHRTRAFERSIKIGSNLTKVQKLLGYGRLGKWLAARKIAQRTANFHMRNARLPEEVRQRVAKLPLREIPAALAAIKRGSETPGRRVVREQKRKTAEVFLQALKDRDKGIKHLRDHMATMRGDHLDRRDVEHAIQLMLGGVPMPALPGTVEDVSQPSRPVDANERMRLIAKQTQLHYLAEARKRRGGRE
jgi:hypothetical protein